MSRKNLNQDLNVKALQTQEYFFILTAGQILAALGGWWPLPFHSDRPPLSGLVGPLSLASRVLCLAPGPHAAAERTQLLAQRGQRARLGVVSGFMYIEFHA